MTDGVLSFSPPVYEGTHCDWREEGAALGAPESLEAFEDGRKWAVPPMVEDLGGGLYDFAGKSSVWVEATDLLRVEAQVHWPLVPDGSNFAGVQQSVGLVDANVELELDYDGAAPRVTWYGSSFTGDPATTGTVAYDDEMTMAIELDRVARTVEYFVDGVSMGSHSLDVELAASNVTAFVDADESMLAYVHAVALSGPSGDIARFGDVDFSVDGEGGTTTTTEASTTTTTEPTTTTTAPPWTPPPPTDAQRSAAHMIAALVMILLGLLTGGAVFKTGGNR